MSRVMFMTFAGEKRWDEKAHPHEAPKVMTVPMILLAVGSVASGGFLIVNGRLLSFLRPVTGGPAAGSAIFTPAGWVTLALVVAGLRDRLGGLRAAGDPGHRARRATRSRWPPARTCTATRSTSRC